MTDLYLAVGHGIRPDGKFDPGARGADGRYEHFEATQVVAEAVEGLVRSGVNVVHEAHGSGGPDFDPDPNFSGSWKKANATGARYALEVHFDWVEAPRGGFGFWASDAGKVLADAVRDQWIAAGLPTRDRWHTKRTNLGFINNTTMPAALWECDRVQDYDQATNEKMGEAIAAGACNALGISYVPQTAVGDPDRPYYHVVVLGVGHVDDILGYQLAKRHALKQVAAETSRPHAQLLDIDCHTIAAVGGPAFDLATVALAEGRCDRIIPLSGEGRYETADEVMAKILGPDLTDRRNPWAA